MSILNRLRLDSHLDDAAIAAVWAGNTLEGQPASDRHLDACAACRARVDELSGWLAQVRAEGIAEADEHFPADRLAVQHAQIVRRLEVADRPPRVIAFPKASAPLTSRSSHASRWIAAAAAAGLIVGVGVGQVMDLRRETLGPDDVVILPAFGVTVTDMAQLSTQGCTVTTSEDVYEREGGREPFGGREGIHDFVMPRPRATPD